MAINIYDELAALSARLDKLEAVPPPPAEKLRMQVAPVTYFRNGALWNATLAAKPALAMINPGSGPGPSADSLYVGLVPRCRGEGVPVFGYVHTKYGARPAAEVKADILNHRAWYGIDGIFVDTTSTKVEHLPYYADLCGFIHSLGLKVCLNPGTRGPEEHAVMADYVMYCETDLATFKTLSAPTWAAKYPGKLWTVVHTCPAADMPYVVAEAQRRGAALVYVTDDVMANPYNTLPTYWATLCDEVE